MIDNIPKEYKVYTVDFSDTGLQKYVVFHAPDIGGNVRICLDDETYMVENGSLRGDYYLKANDVQIEKIKKQVVEELGSDWLNTLKDAPVRSMYDKKEVEGFSVGEMKDVVAAYQEEFAVVRLSMGEGERFNEFHEGKIAIGLMERGYSKDEVARGIGENTPNEVVRARGDERFALSYGMNLAVKAEVVVSLRVEIYNVGVASDGERLTADAKYRTCALELLKGKGERGQDVVMQSGTDKSIARWMAKDGYEQGEIEGAIRDCSPVGNEPGRNPGGYAQKLVSDVQREYQEKVQYVQQENEKYDQVAALYVKKILAMEENNRKRSEEIGKQVEKNRTYADGRAVRGMIEEGVSPMNAVRAIAQLSPKAREVSEKYPDKKPEGYGQAIVDGVRREMKAEQAVVSYEPPVDGKLTLADQYREIAKRVAITEMNNPKFLLNPAMDLVVADKMLGKGFAKEDVTLAIKEASPRAKTPGIPLSYPEIVVNKVIAIQEKGLEREAIEEQYIQARAQYKEIAAKLVAGRPDAGHTNRVDGKIAAIMLQSGKDVSMVSKVIELESPVPKEVPQLKGKAAGYAYGVTMRTADALERKAVIEQSPKERSDGMNMAEEYGFRARVMFEKHGMTVKSDADVVYGMLRDGFKAEELVQVVNDKSPMAVVVGQNAERYGGFLVGREVERLGIEQEKERGVSQRLVNQEVPVGQVVEVKLSAVEEFTRQRKEYVVGDDGKYALADEKKVLRNMLENGHSNDEVRLAFKGYSHHVSDLSSEAGVMATKVMRAVKKDMGVEPPIKGKKQDQGLDK